MCLYNSKSTLSSGGTVGNGIFYSGRCQGVIRRTLEQELRVKGATILRGLEHGSRGIAIVGAVTRKCLVTA
jgi:hypothetical protein